MLFVLHTHEQVDEKSHDWKYIFGTFFKIYNYRGDPSDIVLEFGGNPGGGSRGGGGGNGGNELNMKG